VVDVRLQAVHRPEEPALLSQQLLQTLESVRVTASNSS
jgi:hypothetical protein